MSIGQERMRCGFPGKGNRITHLVMERAHDIVTAKSDEVKKHIRLHIFMDK